MIITRNVRTVSVEMSIVFLAFIDYTLLKMGCFRTAVWGVCMSTPLLLLIGCSLSHHLRVSLDIPRTPLQVAVNHSKGCYANSSINS